jgi:hypothetical protein
VARSTAHTREISRRGQLFDSKVPSRMRYKTFKNIANVIMRWGLMNLTSLEAGNWIRNAMKCWANMNHKIA